MKVLISCTENLKFFIEVLDELELFIDKKVIGRFGVPVIFLGF
jgi:glutaredoxin-related protein